MAEMYPASKIPTRDADETTTSEPESNDSLIEAIQDLYETHDYVKVEGELPTHEYFNVVADTDELRVEHVPEYGADAVRLHDWNVVAQHVKAEWVEQLHGYTLTDDDYYDAPLNCPNDDCDRDVGEFLFEDVDEGDECPDCGTELVREGERNVR